jgi:drug/metabolite transporter (DMT)-like permease
MPVWVGFIIALAVTSVCSLGGVLQKKGIGWQTKGRERDSAWRREFAMWLLGFLLVLLVPALNFIALYAISASVLGAIGGAGVVFNVFFSLLILGEKIKLREIAVSIVLFAGIVVFAAFRGQEGSTRWSRPFFTIAWTLPVAIAAIAWILKRGRYRLTRPPSKSGILIVNSYSIVMAAVSGALGGLMVVIIKLVQIEIFPNFLRYPLLPSCTPTSRRPYSVITRCSWPIAMAR